MLCLVEIYDIILLIAIYIILVSVSSIMPLIMLDDHDIKWMVRNRDKALESPERVYLDVGFQCSPDQEEGMVHIRSRVCTFSINFDLSHTHPSYSPVWLAGIKAQHLLYSMWYIALPRYLFLRK